MKLPVLLSVVVFSLFVVHFSNAHAAIDDNASVVLLRKSCEEGTSTLNNCFTGTGTLVSWISGTRKPNASAPLHVEIGPGTFGRLELTCDTEFTGHISFRGAGRDATIIRFNSFSNVIEITGCTAMEFSSLKAWNTVYGYVQWNGGGTSVWNNVDIVGEGRGWSEGSCATQRGTHYWFGSRITANDAFTIAVGYEAVCDESWFFGSEIRVVADGIYYNGITAPANAPTALLASGNGEIHVYGSVLRVNATSGNSVSSSMTAASVSSGGIIHSHGTGIDVITDGNHAISVLRGQSGGTIHANESAYNLKSNGNITRIVNADGTANIHAPYLWEQHAAAPGITSVNGADMAVKTSGADTHFLIYNSNCAGTGGPWFNVVTGSCD